MSNVDEWQKFLNRNHIGSSRNTFRFIFQDFFVNLKEQLWTLPYVLCATASIPIISSVMLTGYSNGIFRISLMGAALIAVSVLFPIGMWFSAFTRMHLSQILLKKMWLKAVSQNPESDVLEPSSAPSFSDQSELTLKGKGRPRGSGGWQKSDEIIVEKMRQMIQENPDVSVFGAAMHFASEAMGNGEPESKQRRLAQRYKSIYPD